MTNFERIKSFTVDEMTEWLDKMLNQDREDWESIGCYNCIYYGTHHYPSDCGDCEFLGGLKQWLKREHDTTNCQHTRTESTHPYGWIACKDCGKLV